MLQRRIFDDEAFLVALQIPARDVVGIFFFIPAGKQPVQVFRIDEVFADEMRRIGVGGDVLFKIRFVGKHVVDDAAQERDVGSASDRCVHVGHRGGARETRVDVDDGRAAFLGLHDEAKRHRVRFGKVRTLD